MKRRVFRGAHRPGRLACEVIIIRAKNNLENKLYYETVNLILIRAKKNNLKNILMDRKLTMQI